MGATVTSSTAVTPAELKNVPKNFSRKVAERATKVVGLRLNAGFFQAGGGSWRKKWVLKTGAHDEPADAPLTPAPAAAAAATFDTPPSTVGAHVPSSPSSSSFASFSKACCERKGREERETRKQRRGQGVRAQARARAHTHDDRKMGAVAAPKSPLGL